MDHDDDEEEEEGEEEEEDEKEEEDNNNEEEEGEEEKEEEDNNNEEEEEDFMHLESTYLRSCCVSLLIPLFSLSWIQGVAWVNPSCTVNRFVCTDSCMSVNVKCTLN